MAKKGKNKRTLYREALEKASQAKAELARANGDVYAALDSLEVLNESMSYFVKLAREEKPDNLEIKGKYYIEAAQIAEKIAPYRHPKLTSVKVAGDRENPLFNVDGVSSAQLMMELMAKIAEYGVMPSRAATVLLSAPDGPD